ncbi:MAG: regulator [Rhodocyclales bacterium RIFCSPLOWO2_02_FULL_63_24]|nr:MAG: regulator [Rhodocyclales bacterium RIFCSPLOWO2_02_FULL_63_24]
MLNRMKIVTRLSIGFSLMLLGVLVLGFLGTRSIVQLSAISADILRHPFAVTSAVLEVRTDVLAMQKLATDRVGKASAAAADPLPQALARTAARIEKNMATVRQRYSGSPTEIGQIDKALAEWQAARDETLALAKSGHRAQATALNEGRDARLVDAVLREVGDVAEFAVVKAAELERAAETERNTALVTIAVLFAMIAAGGAAVAFLITRSIRQSLQGAVGAVHGLIADSADKVLAAQAVGAGDLSREIVISEPLKIDLDSLPNDELGVLMKTASHLSEVQCALDRAFLEMTQSLRLAHDNEAVRDWLKTGRNELNFLIREEQSTAEMADQVLGFMVTYLKAGVGALYLFDERTVKLCLTATYALAKDRKPGEQFRLGEGVIGQAAREQKVICLTDVPPGYLPIGSALGASVPKLVVAVPLLHGNRLVGVIEIGSFRAFTETELKFVELARETIAIAIDANVAHQKTAELLEQTEQQAEELRVQQEELQQSNEELEERAQMLEQQREKIRLKNQEIEATSLVLQEKVAELERVSTYKSEFLANMSHELRTPLNSLMILSSLLKQNKDGNLSEKQVEFAATINSAGMDLLNLINDILDLSKVEAGQMQFNFAALPVPDICDSVRATFEPLAEQKGLAFRVEADGGIPALFHGDEQRVHQILKNLLSNALKFTEKGEVSLRIATPSAHDNPLPVAALAFIVSDTGIGIPAAKQQLVFDAFQQGDGSISRKYGGTGLGLSISLQLARKMHGEIRMSSEEGKGSVFTLYMPLAAMTGQEPAARSPAAPAAPPRPPLQAPRPPVAPPPQSPASEEALSFPAPLPDDRSHLAAGDKSILIIEDDLNFAKILQGMVKERGFAVLVAADGESGIALAERYLPSAIVLDVMLPHIDGWGVMRSLKDNPRTRHIPVHFITCMEDRQKAMAMGAIGFATKPVSMEQLNEVLQSIEGSLDKAVRRLLIVEDNADEAKSMVALLEEGGVEITVAASGREAIDLLAAQFFDCMVLDLGLSDMSGFDLLDYIQNMEGARRIPVIIHSGRDLNHEDERRLRHFAESIIIKGAKSPERLLNEVTLFLHLVESNLHPNKQRMIRTAIDKEAMLEGRKVLLVDDDMRNIFSLSSVLAEKNMVVVEAENGREALARLEEHHDIGIVLMDIMMPEMDGYAAMREIRKNPRLVNIPIIAMTAKALKGDHEKCMAAGASDYIAKPIEVDKLLSLIRVWIFQHV